MALPSGMVRGVEGLGPSLSGSLVGEAWGLVLVWPEECVQVSPPPPHGLFPATFGRRLFGPMFQVLLWTPVSSMRPHVDWCTVTGCIRTCSHTQRSGRASFLASCPVCAGPWPSPGSLTCGYIFRRRERHLAMYQMTVFQGVLLGRTGRE